MPTNDAKDVKETKTPKKTATKSTSKTSAKSSAKSSSSKSAVVKKPAEKKPAEKKAPVTPKKKAPTKVQKPSVSKDSQEIAGRATTKYIRVSPFKVRLVANKIRNKSVVDALTDLNFIERGCVVEVEKVIKSAAANAYMAKGFRPEDLEIAEIMVDEGPTIKRFRPRAKGAASRINKRTSHITVTVRPGKEA